MIAKLIEYSAKNKLMVFLIVLFLSGWGYYSMKNIALDALPDLSDTQVIIYSEWQGRSPDLIEDQVTYPITSSLLSAPKVRAVRGYSFLGSSFIYVIFEEGTDIYWARSRILEYLQTVRAKIPADVNPILGPDATSLGWGFSYSLIDKSNKLNLAELRTLQDYKIKLALESVPGVSQVASVGGHVRQYQIAIDPNKLAYYNIPLTQVLDKVKRSNREVEGRLLEMSGIEYMIRGRGYVQNIQDLENIAISSDGSGTAVFLKNVANISLGPEIRRGLADLNGQGDTASGIVIVRFGENVLSVIDRVKAKLKNDISPSLPEGVEIVTTYDRSDLIHKAIETLTDEIIKLLLAVSIVCLIFLFHMPSALIVVTILPLSILISFIFMKWLGVTSNIMSLSGIAIAIGTMVDSSIIMVENALKKLEDWDNHGRAGSRTKVIIDAAVEVGPSLFFSLLVISVAFLPIFGLQAQAGRLFIPLAYTKTFAMLLASFLAITITPVMMALLLRGKIPHEDKNPVNHFLQKIYLPVVHFALRFKKTVLGLAVAILALTAYPFLNLGSEFMPPLYEGTLFYMPVTSPGASISEVSKLLQMQDRILMEIPEVKSVFGKAGRAETATDPAPLEMFETTINLKPEKEWRKGMTIEKLKNEMNEALTIPGVANSFTMPIKARTDMLATGIRTPVGIKILGQNLEEIEKIGLAIEKAIREVPGTRSVFAERVGTGYFLDFKIKRWEAARYGLGVDDIQEIIQSGVGGMNLSTIVMGRERYPINVRYARDFRNDVEKMKRILVPITTLKDSQSPGAMKQMQSAQIPLGDLVDIEIKRGANVIKSEGGFLTSYVYIDFSGRDTGSYVADAKKKVAEIKKPDGYRLEWSGEYEFLIATEERLKILIPLALFIIFVLLYLNTKSVISTSIIFLAVPFSLVGAFWFLYLLDYNLSIAVWVGIIALAGLDAETGVVMFLYLQLAHKEWTDKGKMKTTQDLDDAIIHGAVRRIRPKIMTVTVALAGLIPVMFSSGAGSDVMKRIVAPMIGGVVTSAILELVLYPVIFKIWKQRKLTP